MESAAQVVMVILLLGLGFIIVRSSARWRSPFTLETPRSKSPPEQEIKIDRNYTSQSSPVPASTDPPIAEQNGPPSPFNQSAPFAPQQAILPAKKSTDYTVGWICAIVTEYAAAQEFLDEEHEAPDFASPGDTNHYTLGRIGKHNIVIAVLPDGEYGTAAAATVATNMQNSFPNVRIGLLVGIGGGVPSERHDIRLGDVVVSAPRDGKGGVFQYDFGKTMQGRSFQHTRFLNQPPIALRTALVGLQARYKRRGHCIESTINTILNRNPGLRQEYGRPPGNADTLFRAEVIHNTKGCAEFCSKNPLNIIQRRTRTTNEPNPAIYYGLVASANQVMKDALVRDQLAAENDILCFEMEAAGLMNQFPCLVIRGICDYSDTHKNKEWQGFAAMTAAAYAKDILHQIPPSSVEAEKKISDILLDLRDVSETQREIQQEQLDIQKSIVRQGFSDRRLECLHLFRLTSGSQDTTYEWYKDRVETRVEGTCAWFLNHVHFQHWLQEDCGPLLVSADPGCGKSVLAKYLIDKRLPRSATICYFFFKSEDQNTVRQALCALLHQLFAQKPSLITYAMEEFQNNGKDLINSTTSLWTILGNSVRDPDAGPVIIVLDALDECAESECDDLIRKIKSQCSSSRSSRLKYLLTSRPYEQIMARFMELLKSFPYIRIPGEDDSESISQEVNLVIQHRVEQLAKKKRLSDKLKDHLADKLLSIPHRTYLWVYLVFDYLEKEQFKKTLKGIDQMIATMPTSIYAAYEQILTKSLQQVPMVRRALSMILAATRPLTISEMNIALEVDKSSKSIHDLDIEEDTDFKSRLRNWCGLFVSIHNERVYFIHQTAREFLLVQTPTLPTISQDPSWQHSIVYSEAHSALAEACVLYLDLLNNGSGFRDSTRKVGEFLDKYTFLDYSAKNWGIHYREADSSTALCWLSGYGKCHQPHVIILFWP
ncbi:hypothetical protein BDV12DRAFT_205201 [Aspergillus spectabilis]